jgi:hypothetical protein
MHQKKVRKYVTKNYIGAELHAIKSLQKLKKSMKFCPVEGSVAWYKNRYQESTEAPIVGSDLKRHMEVLESCPVKNFCLVRGSFCAPQICKDQGPKSTTRTRVS